MKKLWMAALLAAMAVGCTSSTQFGECVGAFDVKRPELVYKASTRNVVLSILFFGTVFTPALVVLNETYCPVGVKPLEQPAKAQ